MNTKRFELVDFLKGFSIFTIVVMHLLQPIFSSGVMSKAIAFGGAGVHVFILCSGFGLYLSYLHKPLSYEQFLRRRFIKIYIPYIIVITISAIIPFYNTSDSKWIEYASHLLLFKMFFNEYECSYGGQMWFVSTIIQFYLLWPIIISFYKHTKKVNNKLPIIISALLSLIWATSVSIIGRNDYRVWNSFFLQYYWEFVLGMLIADMYNKNADLIKLPKYKHLIITCIIGLSLTAFAGFKGGILKVYNDLPSLIGYLSLALIIYKIAICNRFFLMTNKWSYEWYLVHILVFACVYHIIGLTNIKLSNYINLAIALTTSYIFAYLYHKVLHLIKLK